MPETHSFGTLPITCFAFNGDRSQLALSPNNHEVHIYKNVLGKWQKESVLSEHVQRVHGIDWAAKSNRIVTAGADRNAYVWSETGGQWRPTLVILRINRAATHVKWSPQETKFAVGSGARLISICYFESENDWWVSKHIKKPLRSTVTSLDWHPNNVLIAAGSTDFKARVFSGYVKEVDEKPAATPWGKKMTFGTLMAEFSTGGGGWVHSVSFSHAGDRLAWVGHDSSVSVANAARDNLLSFVKTPYLPFTSCTWVSQSSILVAGHDCCPMLFKYDESGTVSFAAKLDEEKEQTATKITAMKHFKHLDTMAATVEDNVTKLGTTHQNTITQITIYSGDKANMVKFTTSGTDGQIAIWDAKSLESSIAGLRIK
jgi:actin related protein 2/3 complex subunit 1A/1B